MQVEELQADYETAAEARRTATRIIPQLTAKIEELRAELVALRAGGGC